MRLEDWPPELESLALAVERLRHAFALQASASVESGLVSWSRTRRPSGPAGKWFEPAEDQDVGARG